MEENIPQQPIQPPSSPRAAPKIPTIFLIIAILSVGSYFVSANFLNLWPFGALTPIPEFISRQSPSPTSSITNTSIWKIYRNEKYGFEFKYLKTAEVSDSKPLDIEPGSDCCAYISFYNFNSFNGYINNGAFEEAFTYSQVKNQWQVKPGINQPLDDLSCPIENRTKQQTAYYIMGRHTEVNYIFVTQKGIIVIGGGGYPPIDPADVKFDSPQDVLSVACSK